MKGLLTNADRELTGSMEQIWERGFREVRGLPAVTLPPGFVADVSMVQPAAPFNARVLLPSQLRSWPAAIGMHNQQANRQKKDCQ